MSAPSRPCPICGRPATAKHRPFCSARCTHIDLARWLGGNYRVQSEEAAEEGAAGAGEDDGGEPE